MTVQKGRKTLQGRGLALIQILLATALSGWKKLQQVCYKSNNESTGGQENISLLIMCISSQSAFEVPCWG